jgi:hypothetical protein
MIFAGIFPSMIEQNRQSAMNSIPKKNFHMGFPVENVTVQNLPDFQLRCDAERKSRLAGTGRRA